MADPDGWDAFYGRGTGENQGGGGDARSGLVAEMTRRSWDDKRSPTDAPHGTNTAAAVAWADGYNAAVREHYDHVNAVMAHLLTQARDEPLRQGPEWVRELDAVSHERDRHDH